MESLLQQDVEKEGLAEQLPVVMLELLAQSPHVAVLLQQAMTRRQHSDDTANEWLNQLFQQGHQLFRHLRPEADLTDFEIALNMVNMFNLCTGYFSAAGLLNEVSGENVLASENLAAQKATLRKFAASLFV